MPEVAGDLRRAPAKFEKPCPFQGTATCYTVGNRLGKKLVKPLSLVFHHLFCLRTLRYPVRPRVVIFLSFSNAANWQLIKTFLRETLSIGILSAILEN